MHALMACMPSWHACPHGMHALMAYMPSWHACPHGIHALMACMPSWHACPHGMHALMACMPSWHACPHGIHALMAYMPSWHTCPHGIHALMAYMPSWHTCPHGMHAHYDMTSYSYAKAKIDAINALVTEENALGEVGAMQADPIGTAKTCFVTLHGLPRGHPGRLPASYSSSRRRTVPKSKPCLKQQPTCSRTCSEPICRWCCRKRQTRSTKPV